MGLGYEGSDLDHAGDQPREAAAERLLAGLVGVRARVRLEAGSGWG